MAIKRTKTERGNVVTDTTTDLYTQRWNWAWEKLSAELMKGFNPNAGYHPPTIEYLKVGQRTLVATVNADASGMYVESCYFNGKFAQRTYEPWLLTDEAWGKIAAFYWLQQESRTDHDHTCDWARSNRRESAKIAIAIREEFNIGLHRAVTVIECPEHADRVQIALGSYVKYTVTPDGARGILAAMVAAGCEF